MDACADCFKGVRFEGNPEGKLETIAGVKCYVATPARESADEKVVLFMPDAYGIAAVHAQLLADDFARNGYATIIVDVFNDDPYPVEPGADFDIRTWIARHGRETWIPIVDAVVSALKQSGVTRIGTTGYCFGAGQCWYLALENTSNVTVVSHPSLLKVPEDLEKYRDQSKAPLLINSCEIDQQFPIPSQAIADEIFGDSKFAPGYKRTYWDGCTHGFAARGDVSDPKVKIGKEGAFKEAVKFFEKYL